MKALILGAGRRAAALPVLLGLAAAPAAHACSCARETLAQQSARAVLVVEVEALAHWTGPLSARTLLRVERTPVGDYPRPLLLVRHPVEGAACGLIFAPGAHYTLTFGRPIGPAPARINHCRVWPR